MTKIAVFFLLLAFMNGAAAQVIEGTTHPVMVNDGKERPADEVITLKTLGITKVPRFHALIIGVSKYKNTGPGLPDLDMPARDAEKLASILTQKYTFDPEDVTLMTDP